MPSPASAASAAPAAPSKSGLSSKLSTRLGSGGGACTMGLRLTGVTGFSAFAVAALVSEGAAGFTPAADEADEAETAVADVAGACSGVAGGAEAVLAALAVVAGLLAAASVAAAAVLLSPDCFCLSASSLFLISSNFCKSATFFSSSLTLEFASASAFSRAILSSAPAVALLLPAAAPDFDRCSLSFASFAALGCSSIFAVTFPAALCLPSSDFCGDELPTWLASLLR